MMVHGGWPYDLIWLFWKILRSKEMFVDTGRALSKMAPRGVVDRVEVCEAQSFHISLFLARKLITYNTKTFMHTNHQSTQRQMHIIQWKSKVWEDRIRSWCVFSTSRSDPINKPMDKSLHTAEPQKLATKIHTDSWPLQGKPFTDTNLKTLQGSHGL